MSKSLVLVQQAVAKSGLSVRSFATELGMNHSHLSRILAGRVGMGAATIGRLMSVLDTRTGSDLLETFLREERERVLAHHAEAVRNRKTDHAGKSEAG